MGLLQVFIEHLNVKGSGCRLWVFKEFIFFSGENSCLYTQSSDTLEACAKCSGSIKGGVALLVWGKVAFQLELEGGLGTCQIHVGEGYSVWRTWWE